ncbi:alpha-1,2-fucosyltransferase [Vibrio parahaemolyticus]|uniref:Glycosyl transferase family 11 n=2 Tax=Vibrio parahaemolyticus TaxID=670 RepID=A0AAW3IWI0_VIBPH|nr:alpha-1,2-fucosyltransferase [Vibrio parahaemolyticus]EGR3351592.1 alpha-1,2-fucosyltransferase [Vibrio parahaemolyticus]EJG1850348.1 alpha-1,2-fucosyltransferase [Vibrio parahaemolyticus]KOY28476.1 glycosyl transferase family 11 [Vibrio parahaemolyticus]MCS0098978.1 alpha-1,2-fucosyltransferase [Vibrio parahaemolyticus]ODZ73513.1 glycosyl transferase family 11 [Vibrio parahaemolyticus]
MKIVNVVGGLGSQMFAYALYVSLKERFGDQESILLDTSFYRKNKQHNGYELERLFNIKEQPNNLFTKGILLNRGFVFKKLRKLLLKRLDAADNNYNFDPNVFNNENTLYIQSWTSWKYFSDCTDLVQSAFTFKPLKDEKNIEISNIITSVNSVSIHVRRGDYLNSPALSGLAPLWYYRNAIKHLEENTNNPTYFVFSDDIQWCRDNLALSNAHYIDWNTGEDSYKDIQLMSLCKHNIIPNSSFSWWGAFLNENSDKIVIAPETWGNKSVGVELKDMNYPSWLVIPNTEK